MKNLTKTDLLVIKKIALIALKNKAGFYQAAEELNINYEDLANLSNKLKKELNS
jgi:hypothetical protein